MARSETSRREGTHRALGATGSVTVAVASVVLLTLLHDLDHVRQGRDLPTILDLIGAMATASSVGLLVWVARGSALAVRVAALFGVGTAVGLVAVHVLPRWSVVSDPYGAAGVDALSWIGLVALIVTASILVASAWSRIRAD